jgi:hypothetical protein
MFLRAPRARESRATPCALRRAVRRTTILISAGRASAIKEALAIAWRFHSRGFH